MTAPVIRNTILIMLREKLLILYGLKDELPSVGYNPSGNIQITKTAIPGLYEIKASWEGYISLTKNIEIIEDHNQSNIVNFILEKGTVEEFPHYFYDEIIIDKAIKTGDVGGEIFIRQIDNAYDHEILIYNGISILDLDTQVGMVSFTVSGAENITGNKEIIYT